MRLIFKIILKLMGWKVDDKLPPEIKKCLVLAAPHTSNWDFLYAMAFFSILRIKKRFTIKQEWMRFPFSLLTKPFGGIGINRAPITPDAPRKSYVDAMIQLFNENKELVIVITPEGTRSRMEKWKTGFYHIATGAGVPICLGYIDYKNKICGIGKTIYPTNFETDMKTIMQFYKQFTGKFPENFSVDKQYE